VWVPAKVTLFGEHAVVYNYPAIASSLPIGLEVSAELRSGGVDEIVVSSVRARVERVLMKGSSVVDAAAQRGELGKTLSYVSRALDLCRRDSGRLDASFRIHIDSPLPIGVGLGTSASVAVGVYTACMAELGEYRDLEKRAARAGWEVERLVQGAASPMDTHTVAYGGLLFIDPRSPRIVERIECGIEIPLVVGYVPKRYTTAELVARVRELRKRLRVIDRVLECIGSLVEEARKAIEVGDLEALGELMNVNHGLLRALGVVSREIDQIVHTAIALGALGAKMSGAGGGGAFIVLARGIEDAKSVAKALNALGASIVCIGLGREGVRILSR